jgi:hypothetical protein
MTAHPLERTIARYQRDTIPVNTNYSINQIAQSPFLFLSHHTHQYNNIVSRALYQNNPDHYWTESVNNQALTKKETCNGVPDIRKIFFSPINMNIIAQYTHKRVLCKIDPSNHVHVKQIKTIYPPIDVDTNIPGWEKSHDIMRVYTPQHLQPYMEQTYLIHREDISDNIQKQIDKLNYIVIVNCSNKIINNIKFHMYYLNDTNSALNTWDRPVNTSNSVSYTLPSQI